MKTLKIIIYLGIIILLSACNLETSVGNMSSEKTATGDIILITGEQNLSNNTENQMTTATGSNFNPFNQKNLPPLKKDIISDIDGRLERLAKKIDTYTTTNKELSGSTEGGEGIYYYDANNKLKKISATYYGETGNVVYEFYYSSIGNLYFVSETKEEYSHPLYLEEEFGEATITKTESKYYFFKNKLVMYLDETEGEISEEKEIYSQKEKDLLEISKELISL